MRLVKEGKYIKTSITTVSEICMGTICTDPGSPTIIENLELFQFCERNWLKYENKKNLFGIVNKKKLTREQGPRESSQKHHLYFKAL